MDYTMQAQKILEEASKLAQAQKNHFLEPFHLLYALLTKGEDAIHFLIQKSGGDEAILVRWLKEKIDSLPQGGTIQGTPNISSSTQQILQAAENEKNKLGDSYISVEHIFLAFFESAHTVKELLQKASFRKNRLEEAIQLLRAGNKVESPHAEQSYQALKKYAKNLNQLAKEGKIDPVIGREQEIRRVLQILARRTKNNPILLGEPGVGKTAIAEGIAQRIVVGDVPNNMCKKEIVALDMGLLLAGAKYKGEFEERLKAVVKEVVRSNGDIILFIDEIHTLVGAGSGGEGAMDAANLLKPGLARGELHTIGATTLGEYQKYLEKDKALVRRFQTVLILEPSVSDTIAILRGIKEKYEMHHGVQIKDEALLTAAKLTDRYITDRFLPDKAIDAIDEAAAKLRIEKESVPEKLDLLEREIAHLEIEKQAMKREKNQKKVEMLEKKLVDLIAKRNTWRAEWEATRARADEIKAAQENIEKLSQAAEDAARRLDYALAAEIQYGKLVSAEKNLKSLLETQKKGEKGQIEEVGEEDIAEIVSKWTGIPLTKMLQSDKEKLLNLETILSQQVAGQEQAIRAVSQAVRRNRAGLQDAKKPLGSFIFLGTTGVGKTELAKVLAYTLFNDSKALITLDLSEYQERHAVSRLVGAPPGYVGYEEGGQLTEAVRKKPYAVLLLDEMDKAHPDVFNLLLQILDEGRLTDSKGREVNFKNTLIIMTSNLGAQLIQANFEKFAQEKDLEKAAEKSSQEVLQLLAKHVRPEFLNRVDQTIVFRPIDKEVMQEVVNIQLQKLTSFLEEKGIILKIEEPVKKTFVHKGYKPEYGARPLKRLLQQSIIDPISEMILSGKLDSKKVCTAKLGINGEIVIE